MAQQKNPRDWVGLWFAIAREERGIDDLFTVLQLNTKQNKVIQFYDHRHSEKDGVGALGWLLNQQSQTPIPLPQGRSKRPGWWQTLRLFKDLITDSSVRKIRWAVSGSTRPENIHEIAFSVLSKEDTTSLESYARQQGVTLNALLLATLTQVVAPDTVLGDEPFFWVFPVNMRGAVALENPYANHVSAIGIECHKEISPQLVHERIRTLLKKQIHWGIWWASNIGRLIGERGVRRLALKNPDKNVWMGTFSSLGRWETNFTHSNPDEVWTFSPMGSANFPVNFGCTVWNGQLAMTLKIHPSLIDAFSETQRYLDLMRSRLLKLTS